MIRALTQLMLLLILDRACSSVASSTSAATTTTPCPVCPAGKYSDTCDCQACAAGTYSTQEGMRFADNCTACAAGKFSTEEGATSDSVCIDCARGKYSSSSGANSESTCQACKAGTFSTAVGVNSSCTDCEAGLFSTSVGANNSEVCFSCEAGKFSSAGSASCTTCEENSFSSARAEVCTACPSHAHFTNTSTPCSCNAGYSGGDTMCFVHVPSYARFDSVGNFEDDEWGERCGQARLDSELAWCAHSKEDSGKGVFWLQMDTGSLNNFAGVVTQGRKGSKQWVTSFSLQYSSEATAPPTGSDKWTTVLCNDEKCVFPGNWADNDERRYTILSEVHSARYVRIVVEDWKNYPSMRAAVLLSATSDRCTVCSGCLGSWKNFTGPGSCTLCPRTQYSSVWGSSSRTTCTDCYPGTYSSAQGQSACTFCQEGKHSTANAEYNETTCNTCSPGKYSLAGAENCTKCDPGKYSTAAAQSGCTHCAVGKYSTVEAADSQDTCSICAAGKYSSGASQECWMCPHNSSSPLPGSGLTNCSCLPSFSRMFGAWGYWPSHGIDVPFSKWWDVSGNNRHADFERELSIKEQSHGVANVILEDPIWSDCYAGSGAIGPICAAFGGKDEKVRWPPGSIPSTFTICSLSRYRDDTRKRILQGIGGNWLHGHHGGKRGVAYYGKWFAQKSKGTLDDWLVMCGQNQEPGLLYANGEFVGTATGGEGDRQLNINVGNAEEYSKWAVSEVVVWNKALSEAEVSYVSARLLEMLTESDPNAMLCLPCPIGMYLNVEGGCSVCPANSTSPEGSDDVNDCRCRTGFSGPDGEACDACIPGKYKDEEGSAQCNDCAVGTYSPATAAVANSTCKSCPLNSESPVGSDQITDCRCSPGYIGLDGGTCSVCEAGKYKSWDGNGTCLTCPKYSRSAEGSANCTCDPGRSNINNQRCEDINECLLEIHTCPGAPPGNASCFNTQGSFECDCVSGFKWNSSANLCDDLNECTYMLSRCDCDATCQNTFGSFTCSCSEGFAGSGKPGECATTE